MSDKTIHTECEAFRESMVALLQDELDPQPTAQARAHAERCEACTAELEATRSTLEILLQDRPPEVPEETWQAISARITDEVASLPAEPESTEIRPRMVQAEPPLAHRRMALWLSSAAAAAAVLIVLFNSFAADAPVGDVSVTGTARIDVGDGKWTALRDGQTIFAGHALATGPDGRITLQIRDAKSAGVTTVTLDTDSRLRVQDRAELDLAAGRVDARVAPRDTGFKVRTPHAVVEVVGTRFTVETTPEQTRLAVREGAVRFYTDQDPAGGKTVRADRRAVAYPTGAIVVQAPDAAEGLHLRLAMRVQTGGLSPLPIQAGRPIPLEISITSDRRTVALGRLSRGRTALFYLNVGRRTDSKTYWTAFRLGENNRKDESGNMTGAGVTVSPGEPYRFTIDVAAIVTHQLREDGRYTVSVNYYDKDNGVSLQSDDLPITLLTKDD